jgi:phosphate transport system substrate-binding protein
MRIAQKLLPVLILGIWNVVTAGAADQITIAGSTTVKPIVDAAVQQYRKKNPGVEFVVGAGGSGQGIQLISKGSVNIGMSSRPVSVNEKAQAADLVEHQVGLDGVAVIANSANPVAKLTKQQIQAIYTGQITNWKELGGSNAPIAVYTMNSKHGTHDVFAEYFELETSESGAGAALVAAHRRKGESAYSTVMAKALDDPRQMLASIMTNPNAVGYASIGIAAPVAQKGAPVRLVELDGVAANEENVKAGTYRFSRPLLLLTKGEAAGSAKDFITWLTGPDGQAIVRQMDFIPAGK